MPRRGRGSQEPPRTFAWEDLVVWEERRDLLNFMLELAGTIAGCERLAGKERLSCVIEQSGVTASTVYGWLTAGREPHFDNLRQFATGTGVPIGRLWLALRWTTTDELAATLGQEAPALALSAKQRQLLAISAGWTDPEFDLHLHYLSRVHYWEQDQTEPPARP